MAKRKRITTVRELCATMEQIAPTAAAAEWDNVGLLVGDPEWPAQRLLLTIDMTPAVLDEALRGRFDVILAYHPPIFRAIKRLVPDRRAQEGLAAEALASRVAIYSPHTALDAAPGGTNDTIARLAGLTDLAPFQAHAPAGEDCKLVVFVPSEQVDRVADAVFQAGGGRIGEYVKCSYRTEGRGTFFGTASTHPTIGRKGRMEHVDEIRLEIVFSKSRLAEIVSAVRSTHPYDEPAMDVYPLLGMPDVRLGQGRVGRFPNPIPLGKLAYSLSRKIGAESVTLVGRPSQRVKCGLVCVGAAGSLPFEIPGRPCGQGDVVITGEIRHHDALRTLRCGAAAIALDHWASERPVLKPLAGSLKKHLPGLSLAISRKDRSPFERL